MNRIELLDKIAAEHDLTRAQAGRIFATLIDTIVAAVKKGDSVAIAGFGTFKQASRAARAGRNPSTGAAIKVPAAKLPKFTPGLAFKEAVDPKFAKRRAEKAAAKPAAKPVAKKAAKKAAKK